MELIVEIPNAMYEDIKSGKDGYSNYVHTAIRNGTPLPKGHGRLIDADYEVSTDGRTVEYECGYLAPTIVEADEE